MASLTQIANRTLQKMGSTGTLVSLDDNTKSARTLKAAYPIVLEKELRANVWNFAKVRDKLPALSSVPSFGFSLEFQMPTDCLRVLQVGHLRLDLPTISYRNGNEALYKIEGRKILTNIPAPLEVIYISRVTDTSLFDSCFVDVLACRWAIETAKQITGSTEIKGDLKRDYALAIEEARAANAIEIPAEAIADSSWVLSRL